MFYAYKLKNLVNNKIYIGQTNNPTQRWAQHKSAVKHKTGTLLVTRAMIKYGIDKFTFEIIAMAKTQDLVNELERELIQQYNTLDKTIGYNLDPGGGYVERTPEVCAKISAGLNEFYKNNVSKSKGRPLTEEWKQNISEASFGKPGTNLGKNFNDEWKVNMSRGMTGQPRFSKRRFSLDIEKEICDLYLAGNSKYKIAKLYNVYRSLISDILKRNNIEIRKSNYNKNNKSKFTSEEEFEIYNYFINNSISRKDLAKMFNCNLTIIREIFYKYKNPFLKDIK